METRTVQERVIEVLIGGSEQRDLTPESSLSGPPIDMDDTMERADIILDLENEFSIEYIPDDVAEKWQTVADVIAYIESVSHL